MEIEVKVFPKAKKEKVLRDNNLYKVYVKEAAQAGKANKRLVELLADYFKVKKYNITIKRGLSSRQKLIVIDEIGRD